MNVTFRVDASDKIGTGNLMRCLTLAEALRDTGAAVQFFCRQLPGNLIALLKQRSFSVTALPVPAQSAGFSDSDGYAAWLGVSQREDADQVIALLNGSKSNWLVVDHYGLDIEWENRLAPYSDAIMVIDDLANRAHACVLLLDQNYPSEERYFNLVPDYCQLMLGPSFALLRPEYHHFRKFQERRSAAAKRVLVYFGGSDSTNVSSKTMEALSSQSHKHLFVDLVVGNNYSHRAALEQQAANRGLTFIHQSRSHLADLMADADLAIGAGGATTWERFCLGLPSLVVTCAENQVPLARILHNKGLIRLIGESSTITVPDIQYAIRVEIEAPSLISNSDAAMQMCDGAGVSRVINHMREYRI